MAKQIEGVYENVLRCARQEFLEKLMDEQYLKSRREESAGSET